LAMLPADIREINKPKKADTPAAVRNTYLNDIDRTRKLGRPSIAIEGSHSNIAGHHAELDWNDLRKRY
jgi:hypothetical protein